MINHIDDYIATLTVEEQHEIDIASAALDLARLLYQARQERGMSQVAAADQAGMHQQAISRLEHTADNVQRATLQRYLHALGYELDLVVRDATTGALLGQVTIAP